jgi:hypothetical protein
MGCEESFITMKLHWHNYLAFNLDSCAHETCTETESHGVVFKCDTSSLLYCLAG